MRHNLYVYIAVSFVLLSCSSQEQESKINSLMTQKYDCPEESQAEINAWGKSGWSISCVVKHGAFSGYDDEILKMQGSYDRGKKTGVWTWYDKDGNITKKINYDETEKITGHVYTE